MVSMVLLTLPLSLEIGKIAYKRETFNLQHATIFMLREDAAL
jgi:hypothetical protein